MIVFYSHDLLDEKLPALFTYREFFRKWCITNEANIEKVRKGVLQIVLVSH